MLDFNVSLFNNVKDTTPKEHSLLEWLKNTKNPEDNYRNLVEAYQNSMLRKDKEKIPCITIHASYNEHRKEGNEKEKNPLICIDIDRKENRVIDMQLAKELLTKHPSTIYAGFSVSGEFNGVYAIIYLGHNDKLLDYFEYFKKSFSKIGINIDEKCKDYTRLRFFNIDEDAYINLNAKPFLLSNIKEEEKPKPKQKEPTHYERITNVDKVYKIIDRIQQTGIDITQDYQDWVKIGASLAREFGEDGRSMFHQISNKHPSYKAKDCDIKYDSCKKMNKITLSSLFFIAESYGIVYKDY